MLATDSTWHPRYGGRCICCQGSANILGSHTKAGSLCYERVQVQTLTMLLTRANFRHTRWLSCHLFILAGRSFEFYHPSGPQLHALCGTSISHDQRGTERQSILQLDVGCDTGGRYPDIRPGTTRGRNVGRMVRMVSAGTQSILRSRPKVRDNDIGCHLNFQPTSKLSKSDSQRYG